MAQVVERLSPQELKILQLAWDGLSVKESEAVLGLAWQTVKNYRANIYRKFDVRNVEGMLRQGVERGLISALLRWPSGWPGEVR